jgi:hypothetical protein
MRKRQQQQQQSHSGLYENYSRHLCCHKEGPPCLYLYSVAPGMLNSYENKQKIYTWMGGRRTLSFLFHSRIAFRKVIEHRRPIDCYDASSHSSTTRSAKCPRAHSIFNYILFPSNIILFLIGMATRPDDKERDLYIICCCVLYS